MRESKEGWQGGRARREIKEGRRGGKASPLCSRELSEANVHANLSAVIGLAADRGWQRSLRVAKLFPGKGPFT